MDKKGFSLVEVMMVGGLLAGLSLAVVQMNKTMFKGQATAEVKMESIELRRQIISNMADKKACENTLVGRSLGDNITSIKNMANREVFLIGNTYGANALKLEEIIIMDKGDLGNGMRDADLILKFESLKKAAYGTKRKTLQARVKVKANSPTGLITECFDDTDGIIATATEESCHSLKGNWNPSTKSCDLEHLIQKSGDKMTGELEVPSLKSTGEIQAKEIIAEKSEALQFCTGTNCKSIDDLALANQICPKGQVSEGTNADGTVKCKPLQCPPNQYFAGLDVNGNSVCRPYPTNTCPTNEYVAEVKPDGTVICKPIPNNATANCPTGQVLQSISAGVPTCVDDKNVFGKSCASGKLTGFDQNGTPQCSGGGAASSCTWTGWSIETRGQRLDVKTIGCPQNTVMTAFGSSLLICYPQNNDTICFRSGSLRFPSRNISPFWYRNLFFTSYRFKCCPI